MAEVTGNLDQMIEQMVQSNLSEDLDYKRGDAKQKTILHDKVEGEVIAKINQLSEDFRRLIPDNINLPTSIEIAVASQMLVQIEKNPTIPVNQVVVNNKEVLNTLNLDVVYEEENEITPASVVAAGIALGGVVESLMNDPSKQLNRIPTDITNGVQLLFASKSKAAHAVGATAEAKEASVVYMLSATLDSLVELGLKFDQIRDTMQKEQVMKTLAQYKNDGNIQAFQYYSKALGLSEQDVDKFDISHLSNEQDTKSEEDDKLTEEINRVAIRITDLINNADILSPEVIRAQYANIEQLIETSKLPVDGIFKGLSSIAQITPQNREIVNRIIQLGIHKINDPNVEKDFDAWVASYMFGTVKKAMESGDKESAESLLRTINNTALKGYQPITLDELRDFQRKDFEATIVVDENGNYPSAAESLQAFFGKDNLFKDEAQFIVTQEYLEELDRQDAEREAQERDVSQLTQEQKKENILKIMNGMTKAKGIVKSQEWMDNFITNFPDKELIAEAIVEFLEKQKETDEHFMDEDSKDVRESVFESIVLAGVNNPEVFEKMQKIDRETSKVVVKNVIDHVNSSRSVLNNVVSAIQALGKNLNEPEQEVEQDKIVEDTPLGFLKADIIKMEKPKIFDGNKTKGEDQSDEWIR